MCNVLLIGNPNVGKSTLFNSLTKSSEHTGNFHGVTVDVKEKKIKLKNSTYNVIDLPGIYSLNTFTGEEDVTKLKILNGKNINLVLADCNSLKKNLYLCLQLNELGIKYKLLLNNYESFVKNGNKLNIEKLKQRMNLDIEIINAKKIKPTSELFMLSKKSSNNQKYLNSYIEILEHKTKLSKQQIVLALNGEKSNLNEQQIKIINDVMPSIVKARYQQIDNILNDCLEIKKDFIYGYSKADKLILNPFVAIIGFWAFFFASIYVIFFYLGPLIGEFLFDILNFIILQPFNNMLVQLTDNIWLIEFFSNGVFSSFSTLLTFLPQICLMFVFITVLEDSGIISRFAYVLDDFLSMLGLNGKAVYIMLLGLGCNTMSTAVTKSLNGKNLKTKSAILNPYISCMARLPVYVIIASAFFSKVAYLVIVGLYALGIIVACVLAYMLNKTVLKTESGELLLEFAPLKKIDFKHLIQVTIVNAKDFLKRIFGVVLSVGIIVWILTHTDFSFHYTDIISKSILFTIAGYVKFIFAPIGLNNEGIICALIVGVMAKELIVSTISIANNVNTTAELIASLVVSSSAVFFNVPSAISFLIFSSIYAPCISNLAVLKAETDTLTMWLALLSQFTLAYMLSFVVYQALTKGWIYLLVSLMVILLILISIVFIIKKVKQGRCLTCGKCKN